MKGPAFGSDTKQILITDIIIQGIFVIEKQKIALNEGSVITLLSLFLILFWKLIIEGIKKSEKMFEQKDIQNKVN